MRNLLLTGPPGIGKTTSILKLLRLLSGRDLAGFHTAEIREGGERKGFCARTLDGREALLAHVDFRRGPRVGKYGVDVASFEALVLPELERPCEIRILDEIGKMECFSERFVRAARAALGGPAAVVATVALKGGGFIAEVKARPDVEIRALTRENRDAAPEELARLLEK